MVNTKLVMASSAIVMGLAGVAASFMPQELLRGVGAEAGGVLPVMVQVIGALWLGFAMLNWMAKESLIGGIYNRPVLVGNVAHFVVGALALVKFVMVGGAATAVVVATVVYGVFAIAFGMMMFRSPVKTATA